MSADTIVPGAGKPQALNRYAYTFNNPLKYVDPSGHCPEGDEGKTCRDLYEKIGKTYKINLSAESDWSKDDLDLLEDALNFFAARIGRIFYTNISGATIVRSHQTRESRICDDSTACTKGGTVILLNEEFSYSLTKGGASSFRSTMAHELAHIWDFDSRTPNGRSNHGMSKEMETFTGSYCTKFIKGECASNGYNYVLGPKGSKQIADSYAKTNRDEDWAMAVQLTIAPPNSWMLPGTYSPEQWATRQLFVSVKIFYGNLPLVIR